MEIKALNCRVFPEDDIAVLEITVPEVTEALHYDELDFELYTSCKVIKMKGEFKDAEKRESSDFTVINYMNIMNFSSDFL